MIFNGVDIGIGKIKAINNDIIEIYSKDLEKCIYLNYNCFFKDEKLNLDSIKVNESINLNKYLYWDTSFSYKDSSLLFDISDYIITLTRINDKEFKLFVNINLKDKDIIYFYEKSVKFELKTLIINCKIKFNNYPLTK